MAFALSVIRVPSEHYSFYSSVLDNWMMMLVVNAIIRPVSMFPTNWLLYQYRKSKDTPGLWIDFLSARFASSGAGSELSFFSDRILQHVATASELAVIDGNWHRRTNKPAEGPFSCCGWSLLEVAHAWAFVFLCNMLCSLQISRLARISGFPQGLNFAVVWILLVIRDWLSSYLPRHPR